MEVDFQMRLIRLHVAILEIDPNFDSPRTIPEQQFLERLDNGSEQLTNTKTGRDTEFQKLASESKSAKRIARL